MSDELKTENHQCACNGTPESILLLTGLLTLFVPVLEIVLEAHGIHRTSGEFSIPVAITVAAIGFVIALAAMVSLVKFHFRGRIQ